MQYTVDQSHVRLINQRVILNQIFREDTVSRAELSRELKISKSALTDNISSLLSTGIIQEVGTGQSALSGGRKPIMLKFNKTYKYIIAIDLNYENAIFVLANLAGEIENKFTIQICTESSYAIRLDLIKNAINMLLSSQNIQTDDLATIAFSSPGIQHWDKEHYRVNEQFANWHMPELLQHLKVHYGVDILVSNDVNAAALGELHHGIGNKHRNIVYVSCGLGAGAGLILNKTLYEGSSNCAGEIANFVLNKPFDMSDTLENFVNIGNLMKRIKKEAPEKTLEALEVQGKFTFTDVVRCWQEGDSFLTQCIEEIARMLGIAISNIVSLLNVDLVIIGGEYNVFSSQMIPIINNIVKKTSFSPVEVVKSPLAKYAGILGLFTMVQEQVFTYICTHPPGRDNQSK